MSVSPAPEQLLARIALQVRDAFGFASVRFLGTPGRAEDEPVRAEAEALRADAAPSDALRLPLRVDGALAGWLVAEPAPGARPLDEHGRRLLATIGEVASVVLEQAVHRREQDRALEELRRIDRAKEEFAAVASHELRTPIAVVHGIATTLHYRHDVLDERQRSDLRVLLYEQTQRLAELAEQLLDLSRADAGRVDVTAAAFPVREAVAGLVERVVPGREDEVELAIDPRREVVSDRVAFERVVGNLLANAFKYGCPPVRVAVADERGGGGVRVAIEDRGPGVDPEFAPRLFERFTRSDAARRGSAAGAGLGLAIAQRYAEAIGGSLRYERVRAAGGARFVLTLPR
ncbi:MAG TPA: HAMP domain-containing sensor histidine kinase [Gaiellaceae bacterium]|nr:HAMP domain-containing sensor histidine kinase [Gaiellaceae bacterium]